MPRSSTDDVNVAIIGAGFISDYHISSIVEAGGARIAALVGRRREPAEAKAAKFGITRVETDHRRVLDDPAIDAVVIASPDNTHEPIAVEALKAGKAVLLQKPMALDSAQCRSIIRAAGTDGRLTVSFMHRYFPEVAWLRETLAGGKLGAVHALRIRNATPGADWADWFFRPGNVSGGVVMQLGVHGIDLCRHLRGEIVDVQALMATRQPRRILADGRTVETALEDNVAATYRMRDGALVSHEMSYTEKAGCDRFRLELYAEGGTVWLRSGRGAAAIHAAAVTGVEDWVVPTLPDAPFGQAHHRHWLDIVRGKAKPDDTAHAGLRSVLVAEAIYASARSGERVVLEAEDME